MPRKDSVTARLKRLIEEERIRKRVESSAKCFWGPLLDPASDLDPILQLALDLSAVVQLKSNEVALKKAFKSFDLAPDVPGHWHLLINYLARSLFETKRA